MKYPNSNVFKSRIMNYPKHTHATLGRYYLREKRIDLTHLNVYTIDPDGSIDADDGFSVDQSGDIYVHIADPTSFFVPFDEIFECVRSNGVTQYPLLQGTKHMFSKDIINNCSLIDGIKPAITVKITLGDEYNILKSDIILTTIKCDSDYRFTYVNSYEHFRNPSSKHYKTLRYIYNFTNHSRMTRLNWEELPAIPPIASVTMKDGVLSYKTQTGGEAIMRKIIEELAIQTNAIIATNLYNKDITEFIGRECRGLFGRIPDTENLIFSMLSQNIKAKYSNSFNSHEILNIKSYCHFTSPLRRFSDCIIHFLVKHYLFENNHSLLFPDLNVYIEECNQSSRLHKRMIFAMNKYCMYYYIRQQLSKNKKPILKVFHTGQSGAFINGLIHTIDNFHIQVSYTILKSKGISNEYLLKTQNQESNIHITNIGNIQNKFDSGILPELESFLKGF